MSRVSVTLKEIEYLVKQDKRRDAEIKNAPRMEFMVGGRVYSKSTARVDPPSHEEWAIVLRAREVFGLSFDPEDRIRYMKREGIEVAYSNPNKDTMIMFFH